MGVLPKVLGLAVAGVLIIVLYLAVPVLSAVNGGVADPSPANSPLGFVVYLGLALTAFFTSMVMLLASTGGGPQN